MARIKTKDLPVILLTGVNQPFPMDFSAKDIDGDWMPVQDFVEKPSSEQRLFKAVDRLLSRLPGQGEERRGPGARRKP